MSADKSDRFRPPEWLTEWVTVLAAVGVPSATWGLLNAFFKDMEVDVQIDLRLLLTFCIVTPVGLGTLIWRSWKITGRRTKLSPDEQTILRFMAENDGEDFSARMVLPGWTGSSVNFNYCWGRLARYGFIVLTGISGTEPCYRISQKGRSYLIEKRIVT